MQAVSLLEVMGTRSWAQCVDFVKLLTETEGIEDIGNRLCRERYISQ